MLRLQQGIFSPHDPYFKSFPATYLSCITHDFDFRELIPEFYSLQTDVYINTEEMDLGLDELVKDVELPQWASDCSHFSELMRTALESDYVSEHINDWIDLIFGYKQTGTEAETASNQYSESCYRGTVQWTQLQSDEERAAYKVLVRDFGQHPRQVFTLPHPQRLFRWTQTLGPGVSSQDTLQLKRKIELLQDEIQSITEQYRRELRELEDLEKEEIVDLISSQKSELRNIKEKIAVLEAKQGSQGSLPKSAVHRIPSLAGNKPTEGNSRKYPPRAAKTARNYDVRGNKNHSDTVNLLEKQSKPGTIGTVVRGK